MWVCHVKGAVGRTSGRLGLLGKLVGSAWDADGQNLGKVCGGVIGPPLECSSVAWSTAACAQLQSLDGVRSRALWVIAGSMGSTPIAGMLGAAGVRALIRAHKEYDPDGEEQMCVSEPSEGWI